MKTFLIESTSFIVSLFSVWLTRKIAYSHNWVAKPRKDRWHKKPVALYGGIGIFIPFVIFSIAVLARQDNDIILKILLPILTGAVFAFLLGLFDDIKNFKPATKLIGQIIIASLPISVGLILAITPWYLANVLLTYFWFIGIINAVNMIDNMDGLSSGVVMISTLSIIIILLGFYGIDSNNPSLHLAFVFLCSIAGFWVFNRYPASIFMGDSGSLFLGYILATIAVPSKLNGFLGTPSSMLALLLPVTIIAIPIFDTTFVTILRKLNGRPASLGGKDHSSHRLVGLGFSEKKSVLILYMLGIAGSSVAVFAIIWPALSIPLIVLYFTLLCMIGIYLGRVKIYSEPVHSHGKEARWTPLVSQLFHKRQAGQVILDIILIAVSYYIAYLLRFEGSLKEQSLNYTQSLPIIIASCMISLFIQGIYRGIWRLISIDDIGRYLKGTILGTGIGILLIVALYRFGGYSRTVFMIFSVMLFLLLIGSRLFFRLLDNAINKERSHDNKINVLIYGAGQAGKLLFEETIRNPLYKEYKVVGFVDDDSSKHNRLIAGVNIFKNGLPFACRMRIDELWISSSKIAKDNINTLLSCLGDETKIKSFRLIIE